MAYNFKKMSAKRFISFFLALSLVSSTLYLPTFAPRTEAFLGFGDITFEVGSSVRSIIDAIGMSIAQQMIDHMVKSTVKWAQTGFEGNPAYVTDPKQYFTDLSDGIAGNFINGSDLNFLCSPFQTQVKLALQKQYTQQPQFQCTLSGVVANIDAFYNDFSQGGWDGWFAMTQNDSNNPYGAYLTAKVELDSRIASAVGLEKEQLNWNQGFLSWSECVDYELLGFNPDGSPINGKCEQRGPVQTPGSIIKSQLDKVLPSGLDKLITAQSMDQLVSSFASGLLTRFVFGPKGLFGKGASGSNTAASGASGGNRTGMIDLDNDGVPDGQDSDYDGRLISSTDTCFHGNTPPNCTLSQTVTSSPYFTPVCEAVDGAVATLGEYTKFLDSHADQVEGGGSLKGAIIGRVLAGPVGLAIGIFGLGGGSGADDFKNKADADIWANRTSEANSAVDEILSRIRDRHSSYFDEMEINTNRFANYLGKALESLIKDKDLDLATRRGNGGGGLENLMKHTAYNLRYFQEVKTKIGKCENPNISVVEDIASPPTVEELPGEGSGGGEQTTCTANGKAEQDYMLPLLLAGTSPQTVTDMTNQQFNLTTGNEAVYYPANNTIGLPEFYLAGPTAGRPVSPETGQTWNVVTRCGDGPAPGGGGGTGGSGPATSLQSQIEEEIKRYTLPTTPAQQGQILNAVAWNNRNSGWVLLGKAGGNNCPAPNGTLISCDYLVHQPTMYGYDVFINEGSFNMRAGWLGPDTSIAGQVSSGARTLVPPIAP